MKKIIRTDIFTFDKLISQDRLYVDKTEYVYKLVNRNAESSYYFISRPRRYGKSLMCSTIDALFEGKKELFDGLYISETDYDFEKYPVIHFDFANLPTENYDCFVKGLQDKIENQAKRIGLSIKRSAPAIMLSDIFEKTEKELVLTIDEYDAPIIHSLDKEWLDKMRTVFNSFYATTKTYERKVRFFFVTGITKLANLSIFSTLNNLKDISLRAEYAGMFGYTEEEVESCFSDYIDDYMARNDRKYETRKEFVDNIRTYYDGYSFSPLSETKVYNPVSLGCFFMENCAFRNYWQETAVSTLAIELAKRFNLLSLVTDSPLVALSTFTSFDIVAIKDRNLNREQALVLLYYTGYLTILSGTERTVSLTFPNQEIRTSFTCDLIQRYTNNQIVPLTLGDRLSFAAAKEDTDEIMALLKDYYNQFIYQFFNNEEVEEDEEKKAKKKKLIPESTFQLMLYALFVAVTVDPRAEEPTTLGRSDIVFFSSDIVYVLELKVDESAEKALEQIKEKGYAERYRLNHHSIHLLGINFSSRKRQIVDWKEETIHC
jgi:hypothetical protein